MSTVTYNMLKHDVNLWYTNIKRKFWVYLNSDCCQQFNNHEGLSLPLSVFGLSSVRKSIIGGTIFVVSNMLLPIETPKEVRKSSFGDILSTPPIQVTPKEVNLNY